MKRMNFYIRAALCVAIWMLAASIAFAGDADPLASFTREWRDDPSWRQGRVETSVFDAVRDIDGKPHAYQARLLTRIAWADPNTKTVSATNQGREIFLQQLTENISDDHRYITTIFVGTTDFKSLKVEVGAQDENGAAYKRFVNHAGECQWQQFSHLPGEGERHGSYQPPKNFAFADALSVVLRGLPPKADVPVTLMVVESQAEARWTDPEPQKRFVIYEGREILELPIGRVEAHRVRVSPTVRIYEKMDATHHFWFAADGAPPWLHRMVRYEGPDGTRLELRAIENTENTENTEPPVP